MKILFIGNSHTYYNDLPRIVRDLLASVGRRADVVMETEGGKGLIYHCPRKDALFNIRYGGYDVVVMQDKATNFNAEEFAQGLDTLVADALETTTASRILYMPWANQGKPEQQAPMTAAYVAAAEKNACILAPVGEVWHALLRETPDLALYRPDGNHATPLGSYLAASVLFYAITGRVRPIQPKDDDALITRLGLEGETCRRFHRAAAKTMREYR